MDSGEPRVSIEVGGRGHPGAVGAGVYARRSLRQPVVAVRGVHEAGVVRETGRTAGRQRNRAGVVHGRGAAPVRKFTAETVVLDNNAVGHTTTARARPDARPRTV